jgi:hypothetical protein
MQNLTQIPEYAGYFINVETGLVYSAKSGELRLLQSRIGPNGYLSVTMTDSNGNRHPVEIHRVIAKLVIPNPSNLPEVNHMDCNKLNNHPSNLEWTSRVGNQNHAYQSNMHGRSRRVLAESLLTGEFLEFYSARAAAREFGVSAMTMHERLQKPHRPWDDYWIQYM